jgi:ATP-dependent exoDNAse (exonuclease V) alpha subunit
MTFNFSKDQELGWELLNGSDNIFLTGEAGSGKSYLIRQFIKSKNLRQFPVLASTGAAAVLVGGRTFHSFMGLGIMEGGVHKTIEKALKDKKLKKRLKEIEGFVVDEISMLSGSTIYAADQICRLVRETPQPWGGLRVIMVGDFAQLPPVERNKLSREWAFRSPTWETSDFKSVLLKQNMRSQNSEFLNVLNLIRKGLADESVAEFLNSKKSDLDIDSDFEGTRLFPLRQQAESYNLKELHKLDGKLYQFSTEYSGSSQHIEALKKSGPLSEELFLKLNALVMLRQNDPKMRWVNGSTGFIRKIEDDFLEVELLNRKVVEISPADFSLLNADGQVVANARNFPISLAYATTIHKAQGMTLDRLQVNLKSLWEPGQAYVAVSRITDPTELKVEDWHTSSIKADPIVISFYEQLIGTS